MSNVYAIFVEGLDLGKAIGDLEPRIVLAAQRAINATAALGRTQAASEIARQVNFPAGYLAPSTGRLYVSQQATNTRLSATIAARTRPTSLARFVLGSPTVGGRNQQGIQVAVHPGAAKLLKRAFLLRLKSGSSLTEATNNLGLAVRTKGGPPPGAYKPTQIGPNLWLLYGPSVDQAFKGAADGDRGVRDLIAPGLGAYLVEEYTRLLDLEI